MNILITGSKGFVGKNLIANLKAAKEHQIFEFDIDDSHNFLSDYCKHADFVFHLAGVNRPKKQEEFMLGNFGFTKTLLEELKKHNNKCPVLITSSIQAELDNPYGKSKKAGEELLSKYSAVTGAKAYIYRLPNLFGKWCRPNYNSVIATFCHNIANDLDITINDKDHILTLVYIDDLIDEFMFALKGTPHTDGGICYVPVTYRESLGKVAELLKSFKQSRIDLSVPNVANEFEKKLYSTYLSYLSECDFGYPLKMNIDDRGSFTEVLRTEACGQFSVNISKKGIEKGNHWHNTKCEKFVVVSGSAKINFRKIGDDRIISYDVTGDHIQVIDIPVGYTHNIVNTGEGDLVTFMWANEPFNAKAPDTFFEPVYKPNKSIKQ